MTTTSPSSTAASPSEADKAAVVAIPQRIVAAWAEHDAQAFADVFTEDGSLILPGLYHRSRAEIRSFMAAAFEGPFKDTRVTGQPVDIRFLGGETGVLITQGGVLAPGETEVSPERAIRASWLVVKRDGQWRLAAYQNTPVNTPVSQA
ncbi:SgcJ/EcaC family oxidoreductase [Streptosporangium sp. NPDC051023]|uniref:SgcJ/EcaC family oxidoreductase n=1 Tax=Streptosporangium sp. NPDC051023 TaxID=3155410 RepID=UPI00344FFA24